MAEGVFRPKREVVNSDEQSDVTEKLAEMAQFRSAASGSEEDMPDFDSRIKMDGNIPPQLQAKIAASKRASSDNPGMQKANKNERFDDSQYSIKRDTKLADLIKSIKQDNNLFEEVTLPSKGKFYDGESGPAGGSIFIRPMTGEEELILATPRFVKKGQAINMIFDNCIQGGFKSAKLLTVDRTYLLIYLRGISYSTNYEVEVKCPLCDRKFATEISLSDLLVDECPDDFTEESLSGELPVTKLPFTYRLANGEDEQRVQDYRERRIKNFDTAGQPDDTMSYRTAMLVNSIQEVVEIHQKQMLLKALPVADSNYLRNIVNTPPFGVNTEVNINCPACLGDFDMELPLEANFFFPRAKKQTRVMN